MRFSSSTKNTRRAAGALKKARNESLQASTHQVLTASGERNVCSTAIWERRTVEEELTYEVYKYRFHKYDVSRTGTLSVDEVFELFDAEFGSTEGRPKVLHIMQLIEAFSAENSGVLNLSEFTTMMHYIDVCNEMAPQSISEGNEETKTGATTNHIIAAIKMYEKSIKLTHSRLVEKLQPINSIINMKDVGMQDETDEPNPMDTAFDSLYGPNQMRCLALVSHNGMKDTMKRFVIANQNVLKKFRLTGTASTMTMLKRVFGEDESVVYGPSCMSGPLGGDAQLVAMLCHEQIGGVVFFEDPLDSHPHNGDIECLNRNIKIYNVAHACNTMSATMMMHSLRYGLEQGKPELLPSFFKTLQCPTVLRYKTGQNEKIKGLTQ